MNETTALVPSNGEILPTAQPTMIRPLATPDEAIDAWEAFQQLKQQLLSKDDMQAIQGRTFVKKSGWRKIAAAFGISTEAVAEDRETLPSGAFLWRVRVRATAPNGRYAEGTAGCASNERKFSHVEHDVYAQAYTRACNRAISDLVGGGEVSAEEVRAEAAPRLSQQQAKELLDQFVLSCDKQSVYFDYPTLCALLLQNADDLRRAFRYFKAKGEGEAPPEEATTDD